MFGKTFLDRGVEYSAVALPSSKFKTELPEVAARACLIARDSVANVLDVLQSSSQMAYLTVKQCEQELDDIESDIDERLPGAITRVSEAKARELLACLRFITELERIGDLMLGIANRVRLPGSRLPAQDTADFIHMGTLLETALDKIHRGFLQLDINIANEVLAGDRNLDRIRHTFFRRHLAGGAAKKLHRSIDVLFIAQAFERAGDHATNLAEELLHLIEGRSFRHMPKRRGGES